MADKHAVTMDKGGYKMLTYKILPSTAAARDDT